jgi:hypothetical protein
MALKNVFEYSPIFGWFLGTFIFIVNSFYTGKNLRNKGATNLK